MSSNLELWNSVEKTPTEHTKPITGKSYRGTSPKPHWLVRRATEVFGPCGIGWGFTVEERVENGAVIADGFCERVHIAKVKVWYIWKDKRGEVEHIGGTEFSGKRSSGKIFTDEDAPKKSVTDALVKALSMIGFAGDIFIGRYDDSKYVADLREEERACAASAETAAPSAPAVPSEAAAHAKATLDACTTIAELAGVWTAKSKGWSQILNDADFASVAAHKDRLKASLPANNQTEKDAA